MTKVMADLREKAALARKAKAEDKEILKKPLPKKYSKPGMTVKNSIKNMLVVVITKILENN